MTAGGSGAVTVMGTGGNTTGSNDFGVYVNTSGLQVTSSGGNLSVTGQGGGSSTVGVEVGSGATVAGTGTITGNVTNSGTVNPGPVGSAGILSITGTYTQTSGATLAIDVGGSSPGSGGYSQLAVSGTATLAGTVHVTLINSFMLSGGTNDQILTFSTRNSTSFTSATGLPAGFIAQFNDSAGPANLSLIPGQNAFTVNNPTDTPMGGETDLRQAIALANATIGANTITFDPTVFATMQTITLGGTALTLANPSGTQTITGPAAGVTISGGGLSTVFVVNSSVTASISGLTITDGHATDGGGLDNSGTTTLTDCTVSGSSDSNRGGGVYSVGHLHVDQLHDQRQLIP